MTTNPSQIPEDLPIPVDDGAAAHLEGMTMPSVSLTSTAGSQIDLAALEGRWVIYIYPRTGRPGEPSPDGWDAIPGARGCDDRSGRSDLRPRMTQIGLEADTQLANAVGCS